MDLMPENSLVVEKAGPLVKEYVEGYSLKGITPIDIRCPYKYVSHKILFHGIHPKNI